MQVSPQSCQHVHRQGRLLLAQPLAIVVEVSAASCVQRALLHAALSDACGLLAAAADGIISVASDVRAPSLAAPHHQAPRSEVPRCVAPRSPEQSALPSPAAMQK